jgi:hypothetical protein
MQFFYRIIVLIAVLLTVFPGVCQVSTARLEGTIQDATGAVVPGATVEALNVKTQFARRSSPTRRGATYFRRWHPASIRSPSRPPVSARQFARH